MDPLDYLFSLERLGMKFGLENMLAICERLGHPERAFRSVIVGGTNGKGSVTAMLAAALHAAGHHVGRYTSPHLQRLEERFVLDEREVEVGPLREVARVVQAAIEGLQEDGTLAAPATFFECATAMAFELFRRARVGIAVLEVGLGGRLDATNVVTPVAAAIVSIDFDHQAQLGDTIESIAFEKAGIIKPGIPVVCGPLPPAAEAVIRQACEARRARYISAEARITAAARLVDGGSVADFRSAARALTDVRLALPGRHQVANATVAMCLAEELAAVGIPVPDDAIRTGLTSANWPARLERREWRGATVLLDAAHNPAGARALAGYLREIGWTGVTLVVGIMRDKDAKGVLDPLMPLCSRLICTTPESPRALPAADLGAVAAPLAGGARVDVIASPHAALQAACHPGTHVVAAGSIFLVGPLRDILR